MVNGTIYYKTEVAFITKLSYQAADDKSAVEWLRDVGLGVNALAK